MKILRSSRANRLSTAVCCVLVCAVFGTGCMASAVKENVEVIKKWKSTQAAALGQLMSDFGEHHVASIYAEMEARLQAEKKEMMAEVNRLAFEQIQACGSELKAKEQDKDQEDISNLRKRLSQAEIDRMNGVGRTTDHYRIVKDLAEEYDAYFSKADQRRNSAWTNVNRHRNRALLRIEAAYQECLPSLASLRKNYEDNREAEDCKKASGSAAKLEQAIRILESLRKDDGHNRGAEDCKEAYDSATNLEQAIDNLEACSNPFICKPPSQQEPDKQNKKNSLSVAICKQNAMLHKVQAEMTKLLEERRKRLWAKTKDALEDLQTTGCSGDEDPEKQDKASSKRDKKTTATETKSGHCRRVVNCGPEESATDGQGTQNEAQSPSADGSGDRQPERGKEEASDGGQD